MEKIICTAYMAAAAFSAILLFTVSGPAEGATLFSCGKGSFYDPRDKGECWTCEGWNRTAYAVTDGKSCSRWVPEHLYRATRHQKAKGLSCPKGQFFDLYDGGACWSCGGGGHRTAYHINSTKACSKPGYEQFKHAKHVAPVSTCGGKGKRPCYLIERVPSCDKGLYENFKDNRCDTLPPGKNAVSASVDSMDRAVHSVNKSCAGFLNAMGDESAMTTAKFYHLGATGELALRGSNHFVTGFYCGVFPYASGILQEVSFVANAPEMFKQGAKEAQKRKAQYAKAFDHAYWHKPCLDLKAGYRELCAIVEALPQKAAADCVSGLWTKVRNEIYQAGLKKNTQPDPEPYMQAMELAGNIYFAEKVDEVFALAELAAAVATEGTSEAVTVAQRIKKVYDFLKKIRTAYRIVMKVHSATNDMRAELNTVPACRPLLN